MYKFVPFLDDSGWTHRASPNVFGLPREAVAVADEATFHFSLQQIFLNSVVWFGVKSNPLNHKSSNGEATIGPPCSKQVCLSNVILKGKTGLLKPVAGMFVASNIPALGVIKLVKDWSITKAKTIGKR